MADTQQVDETTGAAQDVKAERKAAKLAQRIKNAFAKEHGGRDTSKSSDGAAPDRPRGRGRCLGGRGGAHLHDRRRGRQEGRITVHETFDGELAKIKKTGPSEWKRMAGIQLGAPSNG